MSLSYLSNPQHITYNDAQAQVGLTPTSPQQLLLRDLLEIIDSLHQEVVDRQDDLDRNENNADDARSEGYDDGYNEGHDDGQKVGHREADEEYRAQIEELEGAIRKLEDQLRVMSEERDGALAEMRVARAARLLRVGQD